MNHEETRAADGQREKIKPLITARLTYECGGARHEQTSARLFADVLELSAPGFARSLKLGALSAVEAGGYRVTLRHHAGDVALSMVGHLYEDFARSLIGAFNGVVFHESLMSETVHYETKGQYVSPAGETSPAVFRVCETALVVLPQTHALARIPFCLMEKVTAEPYRFTVTDRQGHSHVLQKLGTHTDDFLREFNRREAELVRLTKEKLSELAPADDALARLMMEGLVTPFERIRAVSAPFADALETRLAALIPDEYGYLKSVSERLAVGIKRGLMGSLTGESIILLAPAGGKAILESLGEAAAATYVFGRGGMPWEAFLPLFNESMLAVNFRREPIYMSDDALAKNETYAGAVMRCPALRQLRAQYAGRVAHSGFEAWARALDAHIQKREG